VAGRFSLTPPGFTLWRRARQAWSGGMASDRLRGGSNLDTTLVLRLPCGTTAIPRSERHSHGPEAHRTQPYQNMWYWRAISTGGGPVMTCLVDSLSRGDG
jgi:hypothetical protein